MKKDLERIIYSEEDIKKAVDNLGKQISEDYKGKEIAIVSILNGAYIFTADLMRNINCYCTVDFMQVSTYGDSTSSSGTLKIKRDISGDITGKDVIIVEDILDTGYTMANLTNYLASKKPASMKICTFIDKPARRTQNISADYKCFELNEDFFIVGYGLDYAQKYRNLPFVAILKPEMYS